MAENKVGSGWGEQEYLNTNFCAPCLPLTGKAAETRTFLRTDTRALVVAVVSANDKVALESIVALAAVAL